MSNETRYKYEKRIKELERENADLFAYKLALKNIRDELHNQLKSGTTTYIYWILQRMNGVWK